MTDKEFYKRLREIHDKESQNEEHLIWMSFADPDLPKGQQFLGAVIIKARGLAQATVLTHTMGINPGGEILSMDIPNDLFITDFWQNRLLSREECEELDRILLAQKRNLQ